MHWHGRRSSYGGSVGTSVDVGVDVCEVGGMDVAAGSNKIKKIIKNISIQEKKSKKKNKQKAPAMHWHGQRWCGCSSW
jgi:hypothetical protein